MNEAGTHSNSSVTIGLESPAGLIVIGILILLMLVTAFELGELLSSVKAAKDEAAKDAAKNYTEVRILQKDVQDLNAVLISKGILKRGDLDNPTGAKP